MTPLRDIVCPWLYDTLGAGVERKPEIAAIRQRLLAAAGGRVLEVGAGTGANLRHYPDGVADLTLTDAMAGMLRRAERRSREQGRAAVTTVAAAERLPFADASFDTVVASLVLCSVADQDAALAEIHRVLRPGGTYLFLEHVRTADPAAARKQDRWEPVWRRIAMGCHPNRDTLPRIEAAFRVDEVERSELPHAPALVRPYVLGRAVAG